MRSTFLEAMAGLLQEHALEVVRFEFAYMSARQSGGTRQPPPPMPALIEGYRGLVDSLPADLPLFIGGKSMGGRAASMLADDLWASERIAGLVCLGYPFHPSGKPRSLRTAHLKDLACPALIVQGTRDALGHRDEVATYGLSPSVTLHWIEDGDHDLAVRKASGRTTAEAWREATDAIGAFVMRQLAH